MRSSAFTTSRRSVVRGRSPARRAGVKRAINAPSRSVAPAIRRLRSAGAAAVSLSLAQVTTLVSSRNGRGVARLAPDRAAETLVTGLTQPAGIDVDPTRQLLRAPQVKPDEVAMTPLDAIPLDGA